MTKTDLVNFMAEDTGLTKAEAAKALDSLISAVIEGLQKERKVTITGFCTFTAKDKPARMGRNLKTGEPVKIPARVAATIKAGSKLKEALN